MAKKKKSENEPNIEEKITEVEEQKADEYEGLTDAEKLLLAKEERFLDKEEEEEEPEEEDDSALGNVKKSI